MHRAITPGSSGSAVNIRNITSAPVSLMSKKSPGVHEVDIDLRITFEELGQYGYQQIARVRLIRIDPQTAARR